MSKAYVLEEKRYIQISFDGFESLSEALTYMKKMISENCTIDVELNAIKNKRLPAPKYRASVARYLEILFTDENNFPSYKNIDYSDYIGKPRKFDPDGFYEFVDFKEFDRVTRFEDALGFIFVAGEKGMQLAFNGRYSNTLCYFKRYKDNAFFGVEYWDSGRKGLDMRIRKSEKDISARPYSSFYSLLLLDILLKQTEMRRINLKHEEVINLIEETPENSLEWMMRDALYTKMNSICDGFILPSRLTFSGENEENENLIEDYISTLNEFGYDVKKDTYKWHTIDYKNDDIYRDINSIIYRHLFVNMIQISFLIVSRILHCLKAKRKNLSKSLRRRRAATDIRKMILKNLRFRNHAITTGLIDTMPLSYITHFALVPAHCLYLPRKRKAFKVWLRNIME